MKKSIAILSAFLLLASGSSFTIGTHYCGGEAVVSRVMLGTNYLGCGMADGHSSCEEHESSDQNYNNVPCCENKFHILHAEQVYLIDVFQVATYIDAFKFTDRIFALHPKVEKTLPTEHALPPLIIDIPVLFQTFLI